MQVKIKTVHEHSVVSTEHLLRWGSICPVWINLTESEIIALILSTKISKKNKEIMIIQAFDAVLFISLAKIVLENENNTFAFR